VKDCQEAKKEECNRILPCYSTWNRQQDTFHEEDDFQRYLDTTKKLSLESGVRCRITGFPFHIVRKA